MLTTIAMALALSAINVIFLPHLIGKILAVAIGIGGTSYGLYQHHKTKQFTKSTAALLTSIDEFKSYSNPSTPQAQDCVRRILMELNNLRRMEPRIEKAWDAEGLIVSWGEHLE